MTESSEGAIAIAKPAPNPKPGGPMVVALDLGNFQSTAIAGSKYTTVRSIYSRLPKRVVPSPSASSPIVEMDGERFHVGEKAQDYRGFQAALIGDKTTCARLLFQSTVPMNAIAAGSVELVVTHHSWDAPGVQTQLRRSLAGEHEFFRNGKSHRLVVEKVTIVPEAFGVWHWAFPSGQHSACSMVVDIGGGSWVAGVLDEHGNPLDTALDTRAGVVQLATNISLDERFLEAFRKRSSGAPKIPAIMAGLAEDNRYFRSPDVDWSDWYGELVADWWRTIVGSVQNRFHDWRDRCDRMIVVGGGAHLIKDRIPKGGAIIVPDPPHLAAIAGTLKAYTRRAP